MNDWKSQFKTARGPLSQSQAARAIAPGLSVRTVQDWELGRTQPPAWVQWLILRRLKNSNQAGKQPAAITKY